MYSPDSAFTGRHPVVGPYPARMTRTRNYEFDHVVFLKTHLRLRESRAQRLGCELPVVIQAAAEFPRRPAPDVATPLGPLGRALRTLAPGAGRDNQHGDVPPAQPEGGLQPFREKTVHTGLVPQSLLPPDRQADRNAQTGAVTRNHQTDMHGRPLGAASQVPSHATSSCSVSSPAACRS